jgi:hypothetical protein
MAIMVGSSEIDFLESYIKEQEEKRRRSIPAQVFLNHFQAICSHISNDNNSFDLKQVKYFNKKLFSKPGYDFDKIKRLLWNSWSTEHALNLTLTQKNSDYYKFALHWSFPQAYYSCYLNMHAFCLAIGDKRQSHLELIKAYGDRVTLKNYPSCISFYADGNFKNYGIYNLPLSNSNKSAIAKIKTNADVQSQIATFLKTTRNNSAEYHRNKRQDSSNPIRTKQGAVCQSFNAKQWKIITDKLGPTTLFNILYRLRIKANYNDVETFMHADIDFEAFYKCLIQIVGYINFVHEGYLAKAIGYKKYKTIVNGFPAHLSDSFIQKRFEEKILPLIK